MALEHALLVALRERPASGLELARRFDRSIGYFWTRHAPADLPGAAPDGGRRLGPAHDVAQHGRPDKKVYDVTAVGRRRSPTGSAEPTTRQPLRGDLAVSCAARRTATASAVLGDVARPPGRPPRPGWRTTAARQRDYPDRPALTGRDLDQYLVLRGGIRRRSPGSRG